RARGDLQTVGELVDFGADAAEFRRERGDAVGFFVANVGDVADGRRAFRETRDRGERHDGVADGVHVHVNPAEHLTLSHDNAVVESPDAAAHRGEDVEKTKIALKAVMAVVRESRDFNAPPGDRRGSEKVTCGRRVRFDGVISWFRSAGQLAAWDEEMVG